MIQLAARAARARYDADEVDEAVDFLEWLLRDNFVFLGAREYEIARRRATASSPAPGLGHPRRRGALGLRARRVPLADAAAEALRERALERRPADRLQDQRALAGAPARADGLRRRPPRLARRRDRRRGAPARPVHDQGLRRARLARRRCCTASCARSCASEDLIEGSHDYKAAVALFDSFPKDELFAAPVDDLRRAVVALLALRGHRPRAPARPPRRRRPQRVAHPRAARATRYDADAARARAAAVPARASAPTTSTPSTCSARATRVRVHFPVHAPGGAARASTSRELEHEVVAARPHVGRRAARRARRAPRRRRAGALLAPRWAPRFPSYYKGYDDAARWRRTTSRCFERLERDGEPFVVALQQRARRAHARRALQARARRSSSATRCRCSRTSGCA